MLPFLPHEPHLRFAPDKRIDEGFMFTDAEKYSVRSVNTL